MFRISTPQQIKDQLDTYVIEQLQAKKILSVAVYNHYKRMNASVNREGVEIEKSNILLIGPTGSGKTLLAQTLARFLDVPFAFADATTLTQTGYVGEDVENVILYLLQNASYDLERARRGIVYIDEIDKIARKQDHSPATHDVSGEGVQQALLKILEGTVARVPAKGGQRYSQKEMVAVDTTDILFICGGTFTGLDKIIQRRIGTQAIGFGALNINANRKIRSDIINLVQPEDLLNFGFIPEFIGRLPVIATLDELDEDVLIRILTEPRNALVKQMQKLFELEGVNLRFTEKALKAIAHQVVLKKSGARGLRTIMEACLLDTMYELPSLGNVRECVVDEDAVSKKGMPLLIYEPVMQQA